MNKGTTSSDTPVTRLSKILSKANFLEASRKKTGPKLDHISEIVPADIDESANQEPPTKSLWADGQEFLVRESSNSCSSGYYSNATTRSAPASCISERVCEVVTSKSDQPITTVSVCECTESLTPTPKKLRRAHSCSSRGWLNKRQRRQQWPRISGVSRDKDGCLSVMNSDTNSCPAVISSNANQSVLRRYSLPPVGELGSSGTSDESPGQPKFMNLLSPSRSPSPLKQELSSCSVCPAFKKQRIDSPFKSDLDATLPPEELNEISDHDNVGTLFTNVNLGPRPFFDLLRHHSTPMPPSYSCKPCPNSPIEISDENMGKPIISRSLSEVHSISYEKITRCMSSLSSYILCSDGRRARALPVVDRTSSGLHCVSADTVAELVSGNSKRNINYVIVDCRFPYEYEGGHIKGAINIFTHSDIVQEIFNRVPAQRPPGTSGPPRYLGEDLARRLAVTQREPLSAPCELISDDDDADDDVDELLGNTTSEVSDSDLPCADDDVVLEADLQSDSPKSEPDLSYGSNGTSNSGESNSQDSPFVVIFHCEFSSQRAPALAAFLRSVDRVSNYHRYPFLYFPEIYVMKGGYSAFYRKFSHMCTPRQYVKMFNRDYRNDLRLYKRLTRRVSSACLACIKPQLKDDKKSDARIIDSFCQLPLNLNACCSNVTMCVPHLPQLSCKDGFHMPEYSDISPNTQIENKENCAPTDNMTVEPRVDMVTSPCSVPGGYNKLSSSMVESPLGLAEVVVRVGRQVIAATLGSADTDCAEVARSLGQVKHRESCQTDQLLEGKPPLRCLKRSLTTTALDNQRQLMGSFE
ncbi:unnamed protein product [Heterobilharzia americana]|nr:unnamed protein product [Heterobilharzia americana]CAH8525993.1 unnamed protein product [Heterobilharzia americana]